MEPTRTHRPQIDALRAFAVFGVLYHHFWSDSAAGHLGVRLFFVISGFLITGILVSNHGDSCRTPILARLKAFYARRFLRILPAYYLAIFVALILGLGDVRGTFLWHALFLSNFLFAREGEWGWPTAHLWSLSVEEQFYVIWPVIVWFLPRRTLPVFFIATIIGSVIFRAFYFNSLNSTPDGPALWVATPAAFDALGVGALLSLWFRSRQKGLLAERPVALLLIPCVLLGYWTLSWDPHAFYVWGELLWLLPGALLVLGTAIGFKGPLGRFLEFAPFLFIGRISYGIYLYHLFVWNVALGFGVRSGLSVYFAKGPSAFLIVSSLTVAVSAFSWWFFEKPINRWKARFPYPQDNRD